jgi:hypothetical protein
VTAPTPAPAGSGGGVTVDPAATATGDEGSSLLLIAVVAVLLLALLPVVVVLVLPARRRARRRRAREPSAAIAGAWREAIEELDIRRIPWPESSTPLELARQVPAAAGAATAQPMRALADTYSRARYGAAAPPAREAREAWEQVDALRDALDESSTTMERLRARLSPRRLASVSSSGSDGPQTEPAGWSLRRRRSTND